MDSLPPGPPDPPATVLHQPGFLVSEQQLMVLLGGAIHEGLLESDGEPFAEEVYSDEGFANEYRDLLTSILLMGPAKCPLPPYVSQLMEIEPLLDAQVAEIIDFDATGDLQQRTARLYEQAYSQCRKLEYDPLTSPLISLDDNRQVEFDAILDAETSIGEYEHYLKSLEDLVNPVVAGLRSIFGYYLDANARNLMSFFGNLNADFFARAHQASDEPSSLFADMELYVADALRLDQMYGRQELPSYFPSDLQDFRTIDAQLGNMARDLQEHVDAGLQFGTRADPQRFLRVHCFWRSFFELVNLNFLREATGDSPFLPTSVVLNHPDRTGLTETTDVADRVQTFRLLMAERGLLPNPKTFEDVLRMREDRRIKSLRRAMNDWSLNFGQMAENDAGAVVELREQIQSASRSVQKAETATRVGTLVSCVSLPIAVAEYLSGGQLGGVALAPIGPAISMYSKLKLRKASWVKLGL